MNVEPFNVVPAAKLDKTSPEQRFLINTLWAETGVGVIGGTPKSCLCRARHKHDHAASRIMPCTSVYPLQAGSVPHRRTRHNKVCSPHRQ